jgi:hypothetical protein
MLNCAYANITQLNVTNNTKLVSFMHKLADRFGSFFKCYTSNEVCIIVALGIFIIFIDRQVETNN